MEVEKSPFSRTEYALSMEFNECSIAAAELNKRVQDIFAQATSTEGVVYEYQQSIDGLFRREVQIIPVSNTIGMESGRPVHLSLTREKPDKKNTEPQITLSAIAREDVALPLATFTRRPGQLHCDYVQVGSQINDLNPTVTMVDQEELERAKQLALIKDILGKDGIYFDGPSRIDVDEMRLKMRHIREEHITEAIKERKKEFGMYVNTIYPNDAVRIAVAAMQALKRGLIPKHDKNNIFRLGRFGGCYDWELPQGNRYRFDMRDDTPLNRSTWSSRRRLDKQYDKLTDFLEKVSSYDQISDYGFASDSHDIERLLVFGLVDDILKEKNGKAISRSKPSSMRDLLVSLDAEESFSEILGEYDDDEDALLAKIRKTHNGQVFDTEVEVSNGRGTTSADVRIAVTHDSDGEYTLTHQARPDSMVDSSYVLAGIYKYYLRSRQYEEPETTRELVAILEA